MNYRAFALIGLMAAAANPAPQAYFSSDESIQRRMLQLVADSRETIDLALFEFSSRPLAEGLKRAQARGVAIRLLLDGGKDARSFGAVQAVGVDEQAESLEGAAASGVGDVGVGPERGPQAGGAGDVPEPGAGAGEVEVDERDRPAVPKDDVVEVGVVVTDEVAHHEPRERGWPVVRGGIEPCGGLVVGEEEFGHADESMVGEGPVGVGRYHRGAGDVGENFPALGVYSEKPWCAVESDSFQMVEQGMGGCAGVALGAMDRVADAYDLAAVGDSTG